MANRLKKLKEEQEDLLGFEGPTRNEWGLTIKEEAFVQAYAREGNAAEAARQAGFSPNTAREIGYEYLRLPHITSRLVAIRKATEKGHDGLREKIIHKLMVMADLDVLSIYNEDGSIKPVNEWDLDARTSVVGIETSQAATTFIETKKIKLSDRVKALDMLIKMQGYNAPVKVTPTDNEGNYVPPVFNINVVPPKEPGA